MKRSLNGMIPATLMLVILASGCESQSSAPPPAPSKPSLAQRPARLIEQARGAAGDASLRIEQTARRSNAIRDQIPHR